MVMLVELWVAVGDNMKVGVVFIGGDPDVIIDVVTDVLINILATVMAGVNINVLVNVEVVVAISTLIGVELVVTLSYVVEVMSRDWAGAVIDINKSIDTRADELIDALACV